MPAALIDMRSISKSSPLIAGVSSFSINGTNCHIVLQSTTTTPTPPSAKPTTAEPELLVVSAYNNEALKQATQAMLDILRQPQANLADIAHTSRCGRDHFPARFVTSFPSCSFAGCMLLSDDVSSLHRAAFVGVSAQHVIEQMLAFLAGPTTSSQDGTQPTGLVFCFR